MRAPALTTLAMVIAACSDPEDHARMASELADKWVKESSAPPTAAQSATFHLDLTFDLITADGTPFTGTFSVVDPLVFLMPSIEQGTLWCIPRADFSGDGLSTVTFATYDPNICGDTAQGMGIQSPLEGPYDVAP
jgi:hypothetical protein